ncbi:hypothetical protein GJ496_002996 [Pomphorhynchus laevis]|nr:hypothetical protein GJ496_002996 [Pomphorhynchus laevis]
MGKQYIHNNGKIFNRYEIEKLRRRMLMVKHQLKNQPIKRKLYLTLRNQYQKEQRYLRDAETQPWKLVPRRNGIITSNINMYVWYSHFSEMLDDHKDTVVKKYMSIYYVISASYNRVDELNIDFTMLEIFEEISRSPNHKAVGEDLVCNEQLKRLMQKSIITYRNV